MPARPFRPRLAILLRRSSDRAPALLKLDDDGQLLRSSTHGEDEDDDYVPPKDAAEAKARAYEDAQDGKAPGHGGNKKGTSTSVKVSSVRTS